MKRTLLWGFMVVWLIVIMILMISPNEKVQALPEYSAQTGETCASCHISPSGGGARTPRGQGWIADGKPGTVPDLLSALDLLGVHLTVDPADFNDVPDPGEISPAEPLLLDPGQADLLHQHLFEYPGN